MRVCMVIRTYIAIWVGVSATESMISDLIPSQLLLFFCKYSREREGVIIPCRHTIMCMYLLYGLKAPTTHNYHKLILSQQNSITFIKVLS